MALIIELNLSRLLITACTAVVMDSKEKILKKEVFATSERELLRFVDSVKRPRVLTFEEMNIAQWLYVLLKDRVDQVQVAQSDLK